MQAKVDGSVTTGNSMLSEQSFHFLDHEVPLTCSLGHALCVHAEDKIGTLLGFSPLSEVIAATATALPAVAQAVKQSLALDLQHKCKHVAWGNAAADQPRKVAAATGSGGIRLHADAAPTWMADAPPRARGSGKSEAAAAVGATQSLHSNIITFNRPVKVEPHKQARNENGSSAGYGKMSLNVLKSMFTSAWLMAEAFPAEKKFADS